MRRSIPIVIAIVLATPVVISAQTPERQISFARESKPHSYYVQQAELWSKQLAKDSTSEDNWYNYFRACRNAYGTANWNSDFVKESPALKMGPDILKLMERHIPNSFTYYYLSYLDGGIVPTLAPNLLKAYALNPEFEGISSSMISFAVTSGEDKLRKDVNRHWFTKNEIAVGLMNYGYNVLMSLDSNAILLTQSDNDTYPLWMLQDALGVRTDVRVINIDFLLLEGYRDSIFKTMDIPPITLNADPNIYQTNWQSVTKQILKHYTKPQPLYIGMTLFPELYKEFSDNLWVSGLTYRFASKPPDLLPWNRELYEHRFLLDYVRKPLVLEQNQGNVNAQNLNYISLLETLHAAYRKRHENARAEEVKQLAFDIVARMNKPEWNEQVRAEFK